MHSHTDHSRVTATLTIVFCVIIVVGGIRWLTGVLRTPPQPNTPPPLVEDTRIVVMRGYGDTASGSFYTFTDKDGFLCYTNADEWLAVYRGQPVACIWETPRGAKLP